MDRSTRVGSPVRRPSRPLIVVKGEVAVLYLDIDGTVRKGKDELGRFVNGPGDVEVFPEAVVLMRRWKAIGGRIVGVSNQGGIALGIVEERNVTDAMYETHRQCDGLFDFMTLCPHHPDAKESSAARCWCRKPMAGMIVDAAATLGFIHAGECYPPHLALMVGDRPEDAACAAAASVDFMDAAEWRSKGRFPTAYPKGKDGVVCDCHCHRELVKHMVPCCYPPHGPEA